MRAPPYFVAGAEAWRSGLSPRAVGPVTLAELIDWMHGAPVAEGGSYLHGDGILEAVVTCPRCGGDHLLDDEDGYGYATRWRCQTCDEGVIPVDEYDERMQRPAEMVRDDGPSDGDW